MTPCLKTLCCFFFLRREHVYILIGFRDPTLKFGGLGQGTVLLLYACIWTRVSLHNAHAIGWKTGSYMQIVLSKQPSLLSLHTLIQWGNFCWFMLLWNILLSYTCQVFNICMCAPPTNSTKMIPLHVLLNLEYSERLNVRVHQFSLLLHQCKRSISAKILTK